MQSDNIFALKIGFRWIREFLKQYYLDFYLVYLVRLTWIITNIAVKSSVMFLSFAVDDAVRIIKFTIWLFFNIFSISQSDLAFKIYEMEFFKYLFLLYCWKEGKSYATNVENICQLQ